MRLSSWSGIVLLLLAAHGPANAWDKDTHVSIMRTAILVSPVVEAWSNAGYMDKLIEAAGAFDSADPYCREHAAAVSSHDAAVRAEKLFVQLSSGKMLPSPYLRATVLGQLAHLIADCAVPASLLKTGIVNPQDFFWGTNFVVFRERRTLSAPIGASIRAAGREVSSADDSPSARTAAYRLAVNLVCDVFEMLPPPPSPPAAVAAVAQAPVLFGVDRSGMAQGQRRVPEKDRDIETTVKEGEYRREVTYHHNAWERDPDAPRSFPPLPERAGMVVVEWMVKRSGDAFTARALLLNNTDKCVTDVRLWKGNWKADVAGRFAPYAVRVVDFQVPAAFEGTYAHTSSTPATACAQPPPPADGTSTRRRIVVDASNSAPRFDLDVREVIAGQ